MKKALKINHLVLKLLLAVSLVACGGGGGDGDGGGESPSGVSYTGLTTKAVIDENNAEDLTTGAYQGGQVGGVFTSVGVIQAGESAPAVCSRMLKVSRVLEASLRQVDLLSRSGGTFVGAIYTESDTIYGDCGGSASFVVNVDDQTGDFSGDYNFTNYCVDGVSISGAGNFSGLVDLNTGELLEFSFFFDNLTGTLGSDSFTLDGDVLFDNMVYPATMTMTMLLKDNNTGDVYRVEDYNFTLTEGGNHVDVELSGRYYDPDYGYVTITTPIPLRIYYDDDFPSDGVFIITGDTGIGGGSTKAQLTALSSTTCEVDADTDGDGEYDWNSGVLNWFDL